MRNIKHTNTQTNAYIRLSPARLLGCQCRSHCEDKTREVWMNKIRYLNTNLVLHTQQQQQQQHQQQQQQKDARVNPLRFVTVKLLPAHRMDRRLASLPGCRCQASCADKKNEGVNGYISERICSKRNTYANTHTQNNAYTRLPPARLLGCRCRSHCEDTIHGGVNSPI